MSKIIKKSELDLVIESTMVEAGLTVEDNVKEEDDNTTSCETCGEEKCTCDDTDLVDESAEELAESVKNTTKNLISEDMTLFNKLINFKNK